MAAQADMFAHTRYQSDRITQGVSYFSDAETATESMVYCNKSFDTDTNCEDKINGLIYKVHPTSSHDIYMVEFSTC